MARNNNNKAPDAIVLMLPFSPPLLTSSAVYHPLRSRQKILFFNTVRFLFYWLLVWKILSHGLKKKIILQTGL